MASTDPSRPRRLALAGGYTAGHVYPALAVAAAYHEAVPGASVLFVGTRDGLEAQLVPANGYRFLAIDGAPLFGVGVRGKIRALWRLLRGVHQARRLLRTERVELVVGFGGYASAGALIAARSLGLATVIHEANAAPGLTNRLIGRLADRICLGVDAARRWFPSGKCVVTGIPVRAQIVRVGAERQGLGARFSGRARHLLVTGGSLGSSFLNERVPDLVHRLVSRGLSVEVRHQTGDGDPQPVRAAYEDIGVAATVVVHVNDMAEAYQWADVCIASAGAVTCAELAAVGVPAVVVPLAAASEDHQRANAEVFGEATGMRWVPEAGWDPDGLADHLAALLTDGPACTAAAQRLRSSAHVDAAQRVVMECEGLLASGRDRSCRRG